MGDAAAEVWRPTPGLAVATGPDRVAILDPSRPGHPPVILEGSAAYIWGLLPATAEELVRATVEAGMADDVVPPFLAQLEAAGLAGRQRA
ncbi:hypothetical protein [Nocardioides jejuensis]|uniref:PqqD family protein n=1 Tax=Nocardioides jejuensis TaxID=2502782 RepID=A0A4V2NZS7_9ACTN|nr:hypothetical protein [Nocardioides jejuensis]TCJ30222.1 hypothetical protein EPD65_04880 [Nocardioides jejuensis]